MRIWLIKLEEPLPIDPSYRPYRIGMLASALLARGHDVTRWAGDRMHLTGEERFGSDKSISLSNNEKLEILSSPLKYKRPLSPLRWIDNLYLAHKFKKVALTREAPDIIVAAMPTPELANAAVYVAQHLNVPVILDARDFWPEIFDSEFQGLKKIFAWPVVRMMKWNLSRACRKATSCVGITNFYRDHLLTYAVRPVDPYLDRVFPLGYDETLNHFPQNATDQLRAYWETILKGKDDLKERKLIYFAGRFNSTVLNEIQSVKVLVEKFEKERPEVFFVLCGTGQYEKEIRTTLSRFSNVVMPGEIDSVKLAYLRSISYIAFQPIENRIDYLNSLSNKFFEYISSGLPIITSLAGKTEREIIKNDIGFVYKDEKSLLKLMMKICDDQKLRDDLSNNAKNLFETKYRSKIIYEDFSTHCEAVLAKWGT